MKLLVLHPDVMFASAMAALIENAGHFEVSWFGADMATALGSSAALDGADSPIDSASPLLALPKKPARRDAARTSDALLLVADSAIREEDLAGLKTFKSSGGLVVLLATGETLPTRFAAIADTVVGSKDGAEALFSRLEALGVQKKGLYVADTCSFYLGVRLSRNEVRAAHFMSKGYSNIEIAQAMGVNEQSIKNYLRRLMRKLDCKNRVQLLLKLSGQ